MKRLRLLGALSSMTMVLACMFLVLFVLDRFNGDLKLALQAYNAGPGAVEQYNGNVPYAETRQYVTRVLGYAGLKA